ncbi:ribonuclease HI, partial [Trypanosoma cruzi]
DVAGDPAVTSLVLDLVGAICSGTTPGGAETESSCGPRGVAVRGGERASVQSARRRARMNSYGFLAGCCEWRTMEALKRKASPRVSHRGGAAALPPTRHPPLYCLSGFTQLFCSPVTLRDPACSGTSERRPNTMR